MRIASIGIFITADEIREDRRDKYRNSERGENISVFGELHNRRRNDGHRVLSREER